MHVYKYMFIIVEYMNVYCMYMVYRMTSQRVNANDHMPQQTTAVAGCHQHSQPLFNKPLVNY